MNFQTLDLNLLRVFDAVMAEHSLTRAAARLFMTQPAVSNALRRLRAAVGEDLFIRSAYGVKPTPRAQQIWPPVRETLAALQQTLAPESFDACQTAVSFRLAMADITASRLLPPVATEIERAHWKINIRVQPLTTRDPQPLLNRAEADAAVGFFPVLASEMATSPAAAPIYHERLYNDHYVCVMRAGHPLARHELTVDAFCAAEHVLVNFFGGGRGFVDEALSAVGRERRVLLSVNQFHTAARIVAQTDLLTIMPRSSIGQGRQSSALVVKPFPLPLPEVAVDLAWHERDRNRPAHVFLRALLHRAAATLEAAAKPGR